MDLLTTNSIFKLIFRFSILTSEDFYTVDVKLLSPEALKFSVLGNFPRQSPAAFELSIFVCRPKWSTGLGNAFGEIWQTHSHGWTSAKRQKEYNFSLYCCIGKIQDLTSPAETRPAWHPCILCRMSHLISCLSKKDLEIFCLALGHVWWIWSSVDGSRVRFRV